MRRPLDAYPTETAVTRTLLDRVKIGGDVCEPCAGAGLMADELISRTSCVWLNDIDSSHVSHCDFIGDASLANAGVWKYRNPHRIDLPRHPWHWTVTNPPFIQAIDILRNAWNNSSVGVAFLLRLTFLEPAGKRSGERGDWLAAHEDQMTNLITLGQPRPSFTTDGKTDKATTAWMVWRKDWSWDKMGIERPFQFAMRWK